jgi:uncharacterized membrane protein
MITPQIHRASSALQTAQEGLERVRAGIFVTKRVAWCAGGAFMVTAGLKRKGVSGALLALVGSDLMYRGLGGEGHLYSAVGDAFGRLGNETPRELPYGRGIKVKESVVVHRRAGDLYRIWRDFEVLPAFMPHLSSVEAIDSKRSHWVLKAPAGRAIEWDAEIIADHEGEMIGWRSVDGGVVAHAGSVRFEEVRGGGWTRVVVAMQYNPVGGEAGIAALRLLGSDPRRRIREDLERFREFSESVDLRVVDRLLRRSRNGA